MISLEQKRDITKVGEFGEESEFTIKATAKSFRILISNLYTDKNLAVQKELAQNAADSHIAAGTQEIPFNIYLPSCYEPNFKVRDFGTGITHEYMMKFYTKIFHSSKDESNDYCGSIGVGRCSALSICDSYVLESYIDKIKRIYSIYINERGIPTVAYLGEEETDEENGVLIDIPVNPSVCQDFEEKAKKAYRYFKVRPIIKNRDDFTITENNFIILADNNSFGLLGCHEESIGIMGSYAYNLDIDSITGLTELQKNLLNSGLVVEFNMGDLDVNASREGLHYNTLTIENIKKKLDSIIPEIKPVILQQFKDKNIFEQLALASDLLSYQGKLASISELAKGFLKELNVPESLDFKGITVFSYTWDRRKDKVNVNKSSNFSYVNNTEYYIANKKTHLKLKSKEIFEDSSNQNKRLVFFYPENKTAVEDFNKTYNFDLNTFTDAATLPFQLPHKIGAGGKMKTLIYSGYSRRLKDCWNETELDANDDIIYVVRQGYTINEHGCYGKDDTKRFHNKIEELEKYTSKEYTIYGLTALQLKEKKDNWINFFQLLKEEKDKFVKSQEEKIAAAQYFRDNYNNYPNFIENLNYSEDSLIGKTYAEYKTLKKIHAAVDYSVLYSKVPATDLYKYKTEDLYKNYPLFKAINNNICKEVIAELNHYINNKTIDNLI